ncbi:VanW family protein [Paenibacillus sp. LHD-38]|uniref:VanW family protein n=1 Tax=Paenibacillus sp. LHD-38 TaxID=3072143 RepID=UPI00280D4729|nr:VanW family protein [Paenibacillus sp. LHD-38]MDQ8736973.1 VanW family protein [Paenibacillus sp. LHD-38]
MGLYWILAILMMFQQGHYPDPLVIERNGQVILEMSRAQYSDSRTGIPFVVRDKLNKGMDAIDRQVQKPAVNATLDGGGRILPEHAGSQLDRKLFEEQFYSFIFEGGFSQLEVPMLTIYPRVDSELLSTIKVKRIGQYATYYNSNNKNRSHNVSLAAKAINNYVVFPNERFSFNEVVGKRTKETGYLRAPVIVRGEMSEDIGGGICQISSTLFNAVDRAGLKIIERYSHSRNVKYVPPGRDATVSWYGPDFVFQNKYDQPVLIRAYASGGQVSIVICSSDELIAKKRQVPSASKKLPEEVKLEMDAGGLERDTNKTD